MPSTRLRATREAYGDTLCELISEGLPIMAVDADLAESTTLKRVRDTYPQNFLDVGIAEQCMVGVAAGLSVAGHIPFTGSFAVFATGRAYDQIRNTVCDSNLSVKICPTHAGITVGEDGATHQALEDIGLMRGLPNMRIMVPADYWSAKAAIRLAAETEGPVYVRLGRHPVPELYGAGFKADLPLANLLREGADVSILACGVETHEALRAAELLAKRDVSAEVVDVFSIKPLDEETILASARKTRSVVAVDDHNVETGMGAAVCSLLSRELPTRVLTIGMETFGISGKASELLKYFGLDAEGIAARTLEFLGRD
jgi:transketolase